MATNTLFIVYYDVGIGGVQKKIVDIIEYISKNKDSVHKKIFLLLDGRRPFELKDDLFLSRILKSDIKIHRKPQVRFWRFRFPFTVYVLWKALFHKPDTMLSFMRKYIVISVIAKYIFWWRKIKIVAGYDNVASHELEDVVSSPFKRSVWRKLIRFTFPLTDILVVPSDASRSDLVKNFGVPKNKVVVNKNWVFVPAKWSIKKDNSLLYIGRVDPQKNIGFMIDVVDKIRKFVPLVRLDIVGNGKQIESIKQEIAKKHLTKHIRLVGSQVDVGKYLKTARVFLLTSDYEGLPIAALEAMAYRLPVITTNYPGAGELVVNGKTGFIAKNKVDYIRKVKMLLTNSQKQNSMGIQAQSDIRSRHGIKNLIKFVKLLKSTPR